jgi:N-acetylglucosamine-6-phosphate deacetylase
VTTPAAAGVRTARRLGVSAALVDGKMLPGDVAVQDGVVDAVGLPPARGDRVAVPGLVDLQVNGFDGVDLMSADEGDLRAVGQALARRGVTAYLPTLITAEPSATTRALGRLRQAVESTDPLGARPLGVHLEGPFLSERRLGTHPPGHRRDPDAALLAHWRATGPVVAVTLAPELPGALHLVARLARDGVLVSVGHSDATAEQAHAAFDAGAATVTHLFNAMSPLHHRAPGVPGAALARDDVVVQLIVDGHHLSDDVVRAVWRAARGRVVLVTDATAAAGTPDGPGDGWHPLGEVDLQVRDGAVRNVAGDLAGSALTLDAAVRAAGALRLPLAEVLVAVTETPARLLRRRDIGRLRPGVCADIAVLDDALVVQTTYREGREVPA